MSDPVQPAAHPFDKEMPTTVAVKKRSRWLPVIVLAAVFLAGFGPMWHKSSRLNAELVRVQREARVEKIQITLANAALDARRGD